MKFLKECGILILIVSSFVFSGCGNTGNADSGETSATGSYSENIQKADKIEVVHFHATQQCISCITVGKYALKTIQEKFPEEFKNGKIVFKDINGELPENYDIVVKYQARGSSLFVNAIINGQDNIQEDVKVWRLIGDEKGYIDYFEEKLNKLLGK